MRCDRCGHHHSELTGQNEWKRVKCYSCDSDNGKCAKK